jgi:hypothetical protein
MPAAKKPAKSRARKPGSAPRAPASVAAAASPPPSTAAAIAAVERKTGRKELLLFAANAVISLICAFGAVQFSEYRAEQRARAADRNIDVADYNRGVTRFDNAAQAYAGLLLSSGKVDEKARTELLAALVDEQNTMSRVRTVLPPNRQPTLVAYKAALQDLSRSVNEVTRVEDMAPYWQGLNNVLVLRRDLDADFQRVREANRPKAQG